MHPSAVKSFEISNFCGAASLQKISVQMQQADNRRAFKTPWSLMARMKELSDPTRSDEPDCTFITSLPLSLGGALMFHKCHQDHF